jgi:hypothetical protein
MAFCYPTSKGNRTMPKRSRQRKHLPFATLPLHQRRSAVVQIGWRIASQKDAQASRIFWTDHLLDDPDAPGRIHRWVDVVFVGKDRFTLWNAEFITTAMAVDDAISERAFQAAYALLSADEVEREFAIETVLVPAKRPGQPRMHRWVRRPDRLYPQFEGRSFRQECDRLEAHYRATELPIIGVSFTIDRSYAYGMGLHAVVAESNLDRAAIERTIARFRVVGECDWSPG